MSLRTRRSAPGILVGALCALLASSLRADADDKTVTDLLARHDKALIRDLDDYLKKHPKADDRDEAYQALFDRIIEHDWFLENEAIAKRYLAEQPNGSVRPLAQIVSTLARAQAGRFNEALTIYEKLMGDLGKPEQEEFAANFAEQLGSAAAAAGEIPVARRVYETLLDKYGDANPELKQKVKDDLARLDRVGKPAPTLITTDINGKPFKLSEWKGKVVLVDYWATFAPPCVAEVSNIQALYEKYHARGFEVVSISLDDSAKAVVDFVKARKVPWREVHSATGGGDPVEVFGVNKIPASFLIDQKGTVVRIDPRGPALAKALETLLPSR